MSIFDTGPRRKELIDRLREQFNLSKLYASDEDLLKRTEGTVVRSKIEFLMAFISIRDELIDCIIPILITIAGVAILMAIIVGILENAKDQPIPGTILESTEYSIQYSGDDFEDLILINADGSIWIHSKLSHEDIVKIMFKAGWSDDFKRIFENSNQKGDTP